MSPAPSPAADPRAVTRPRPGHADLAGALKLGLRDARPVLERASARETAARVAAGALAKALLRPLGVEIASHTLSIGGIGVESDDDLPWDAICGIAEDAAFRAARPDLDPSFRALIDAAREKGDTLGGVFEVVAHTPPPGLGHFAQWDLRLDGRIGQAMLSIPAAKSVAIGAGDASPHQPGSAVHDAIESGVSGAFRRPTNRAGGIEGGMTNGEEVRVRVGMKPLSTLMKPLGSVDLETGERAVGAVERSDVTVVPAAGVVGEAMLALVLADAALEKFGGDSLAEIARNLRGYLEAMRRA